MQTAANFLQDKILGGPEPVDPRAVPEYKHRKNPDGTPQMMKALAWFGSEKVEVVDAPIPDITTERDVILKVTGTTVCGSDLHLYHSEIVTMQSGDILGHEFMGVVDKMGSEVKGLKIGQRVVASFQVACGYCRYCKHKESSFCENTNNSSLMGFMYGAKDAGFFGYSHFTGGFPGGQAEYVRVPFGDVNLLPIPDNVTDEQAIYLSDVLPTSYHSVVDTEVGEGDVVGIWGLGPIGLCAAKWALLKGAKRVIGIDLVQDRLAYAKEHVGIEVIDASGGADVVKTVLEMVPGGLDVALDCGTFHEPKGIFHKVQKALMLETDNCETINECIVAVRKRGRVGLIAAYSAFTNGLNIGALMEKGVRLQGNGQAPVHKHWETILNDYIIPGKFDPTFMITHRVPLEDFKTLYDKFDKRVGNIEKVFVETKFSNPPSANCPKTTRAADIGN
ncbi:-like protein [Phaffia rhodozyma]|uniref:-like protein n=1 Tax=Phaffia rhodozyma TaxID=264483 RepID=A0A0F7SEN6_PHARH|nr:-like protein [Phaffia rhodozyma]